MGNLLQSIQLKFCKPSSKVVLIGEFASGRTTALYKLKLNETVSAIPTIGFNVEVVELASTFLQIWDIGGNGKLRELWHHYYQTTDGIAFFFDRSQTDEAYYESSRVLLDKLMNDPHIQHVPLLVFGNKSDIALNSLADVHDILQLGRYRNRKVRVISSCSLTGEGLRQGFQWLSGSINRPK